MTIDYKKHELTIGRHLPRETTDFELPLRVYRLATVRGVVDRDHQANFVIDTGDLTSFGYSQEASIGSMVSRLPVPYYFVPGNHDSFANRALLWIRSV